MALGNDKNVRILIGARDESGPAMSSAQRRLEGIGAAAARMMPLIGAALGAAALKSSVDAWIRQEAAIAQVEARLRSTGGVAGWNSEQLQSMASSLQNVSTFGDEAILEMQSMLLTFTNVRGEVFEKTTEAILDLSVAMNQDLKSSAVQVGKALNNPIEGLSALSRIGVRFTDEQKEQIKTLTESGRVMEAQKVILQELQTEFGGAARASRDTLGGALTSAKNAAGDLSESVGKSLAPALISAANAATELAVALRKAFDPTSDEQVDRLKLHIQSLKEQMIGRDRMPESLRWLYGDLDQNLAEAEAKLQAHIDRVDQEMDRTRGGLGITAPTGGGTTKPDKAALAAEDAADKARFDLRLQKMQAENDARVFLEQQRMVELGRIRQEEDAADQLSFDNRMMRMQAENENREFMSQMSMARIAREVEEERLLAEQKRQLWSASSDAFMNITNALYTMSGKKSRQLFELNKAAGIANAVINTAQAATLALAFPPGPPISFAYVAAAIASGAAQIAAIQSTSFGGGGRAAAAGGYGGGTPNSPIVTQPTGTPAPAQTSTTIIIQGNVIGEDAWVESNLIPALNAASSRNVILEFAR